MQVSAVSFGKKIPIMKCNVRDVWKNKSAEVTLSKYDCKDYSDIKEVYQNCADWTYGHSIASDMNKSRERYFNGREQYPANFYVMQDKNKNIIGLCETMDIGKDTNIEYIESARDAGYKYVGQAMLAMIGKMVLNKGGKNLCVNCPYPGAINFYTEKCGFDKIDDNDTVYSLFMEDYKIGDFIDRVQRKTHSEISEINE